MALSKLRSASFEDTAIHGNRNLIINGAMQVAQRGTSQQITTANGGYFTCDRWRYSQFNNYAADIDATMSQETDTPNNTFKNSFKFLVGTGTAVAAGDAINIEQIIEGQDIVQLAQGTSDAKKFTVSFWVKASIAGTYCISLHSGKSFSSNRSHIKEYTILSANTWEYKTVTVDGDTSGTWAEDNGAGLSLSFTLGAGSTYQGAANTWSDSDYFATSNQTQLTETTNATWFVTGIQFEVGEQATPFEHRSFGDELSRCQRYYYKTVADSAADGFGNGNVNSTVRVDGFIPFKQTMRASPTAIETNGTAGDYRVNQGGANTTCNAVPTIIVATKDGCDTRFHVASGLTVGRGAVMRCVNSGAFLAWSAEL